MKETRPGDMDLVTSRANPVKGVRWHQSRLVSWCSGVLVVFWCLWSFLGVSKTILTKCKN